MLWSRLDVLVRAEPQEATRSGVVLGQLIRAVCRMSACLLLTFLGNDARVAVPEPQSPWPVESHWALELPPSVSKRLQALCLSEGGCCVVSRPLFAGVLAR